MAVLAANFPAENVPQEEKRSKDWLKRFAQAAWASYGNLPEFGVGWRSYIHYEKYKKYANGRQDTAEYKQHTALDNNPDTNQMNVRWDVYPIIPKYRRIALGLLEKTNYALRVDPVDPLAHEEIEKELLMLRSKIVTKNHLVNLNMAEFTNAAALQPDSPEEPEDLDGLNAMEMGYRHRTAMEAEQLVELVLNGNDYENTKQQIREDLFDYGFCALKDFQQGNTVGVRRCDPRRMIVSFCNYNDFRDLKYAGEIQMVQAYKVVADSQGDLTKEDIERVWKMGKINAGINIVPPMAFNSFEDFYNSGQLAILDLEIYTTDQIDMEERIDKYGNRRFWKRSKEKRNGYKYYSKQVENVYRVKWIAGTDLVYDYGQQYNIKRDPQNKSCINSSFHLYGCSLHNMIAFSRTKALIPYADRIQVAAYRLEHALNVSVPKGWAINLDKIEEIDLSAAGEAMTPKDILDMFWNRGVLVYRSKNLAGNKEDNSLPIISLEGGVGNEIAEFWNVIQQNIELMRTTLGLNELTDGSTPNPKLLTTVANLASLGTNNALSDLFYAEKHLTQKLAKSIIIRAQDIIKNGNDEVFRKSLGEGTVRIIKSIDDIKNYIYSVKIEDLPSEQDIQAFNQLVNTALAEKQVTVADVMQLNNISNLKQKELFLAYKVKKNMERAQAEAMQMQQQNGQIQVQSAQAAEEQKRQTIQMEYDLKLRNDLEVKKEERKNLVIQGQYKLEDSRIQGSGRVEASFLQAKGRDEANMRDNATALIKEGKDAEVERINIPADLQSRVEPITTPENPELPIDLSGFSFLDEPENNPQEEIQEAA